MRATTQHRHALPDAGQAPQRPPLRPRLLRALGWAFIAAGAVVMLYVVYSLYFTGFATARAQSELRQQWEQQVAERPGDPVVRSGGTTATPEPQLVPPGPGDAVAVLEFARTGADTAPVRAEPLLVVEGVTRAALARGPGHYPGTALPGQDGNFAVAGHRTTYGAPFFHLDQLAAGDEVRVTDSAGVRHTYRVVEQRIVSPTDVEVLRSDPLGRGVPMLTLTTCHPRFSAAQRLVVFAELAS